MPRAGARARLGETLFQERTMTTVAEVMTRGVRSMSPDESVVLAAQTMDELNVGVIPVVDGEKVIGMVTDRDIVVRGVALERDPKTLKLADVMSAHVRCVREGDEVEAVLAQMAEAQIRRMPVVDGNERLVGIVSLGDVAAKDSGDENEVAMSLGEISTPAQPDRSGSAK
jgi:CBS domain-containing protein